MALDLASCRSGRDGDLDTGERWRRGFGGRGVEDEVEAAQSPVAGEELQRVSAGLRGEGALDREEGAGV